MRTEISKSIHGSVIRLDELRRLLDQLLDAPGETPVRVRDNMDQSPGNHECSITVTYEVES